MDMKVRDLLDKEIEEIFNTMGDLAINSEEYKDACDRVSKLIDKRNEMVKIEYDHLDRKLSLQEDVDLKTMQLDSEKKDRRNRFWLEVGKTALGVGVPFYMGLICLAFERTDNVTTYPGRQTIMELLKFNKKN